MSDVPVVRDFDRELPVPTIWRAALADLANSLALSAPEIKAVTMRLKPVLPDDMRRISTNIQDYGCSLVPLPEASWETSVCRWLGGHWEVLVDLFTDAEGRSDLVMHVTVAEQDGFLVSLHDVYVP
ncbi:MAG: hypothetical protein JJ884_09270 [Maricaulis sp.]|uniref:DUF7668 domain-containing protein n=1 Tax=Maricaulis sp. TaxID=1486257 RepID=UPI001B10C214|nr:hypothetical protein [Maricaulis sp.]MBO6730091.1 hypothetical protein [Maricaulis sp.]MBO6847695.1 hypothetical protein [Maricaulis sp.]MBO6878486.1 hypothetical protein [Maricaulis sp.]